MLRCILCVWVDGTTTTDNPTIQFGTWEQFRLSTLYSCLHNNNNHHHTIQSRGRLLLLYDTVVAKSIYFVGKWYQRAFFHVVHTRCLLVVGLSTGIWHSFNIRSLVAGGGGGRDRAMHRRLLFLLGSALDFISKHIVAGAYIAFACESDLHCYTRLHELCAFYI